MRECGEREHLLDLHKITNANKDQGKKWEAFSEAAIEKGFVILQITNSHPYLHVVYTICHFSLASNKKEEYMFGRVLILRAIGT